jgi:hypothetical protein
MANTDKFERIKKSNDEGLEWYVVKKNGIEMYHCQTIAQADSWIALSKNRSKEG